MLSDTSPEAEQVLIELLRRASPAQRFAAVRRHTCAMVALSRRAIASAHPELDELGVALKWAELHYGRELADQVRAYLEKR